MHSSKLFDKMSTSHICFNAHDKNKKEIINRTNEPIIITFDDEDIFYNFPRTINEK